MRSEAEQKVLDTFRETTKHLLPQGIQYVDREKFKYVGSVYLPYIRDCSATYNMRVCIEDESEEIRFEVRNGKLILGWGGNNLVTVDADDRWDRINCMKVCLIADIVSKKDAWISAINRVDYSPIKKEQDELKAKEEAEANARFKYLMEVYEEAKISVGTTIIEVRFGTTYVVQRISGKRVQMNDKFYSKEEIARKLEAEEWQVVT